MIVFVPAYDRATSANLTVVHGDLPGDALIGAQARREALLPALSARPEAALFAMPHGRPDHLCEQGGGVALNADDAAQVRDRAVFAWACHTATALGRTLSQAGATWWGYTGPICAPGDGDLEVEIFGDLFETIRARFWVDPSGLKADIQALCEEAASRLDEIGAPMSSYLSILHVWDRLRVWPPGAEEAWRHPASLPPTWMS